MARAIASPFAAIIGLAFASGPVADIMIDVVVIMIITGIVKRSMPGALKMVRRHGQWWVWFARYARHGLHRLHLKARGCPPHS